MLRRKDQHLGDQPALIRFNFNSPIPMTSTTRKWVSAISAGAVLLAVVFWLVNRHPHPVVAPVTPTAEIADAPAAKAVDVPSVSQTDASAPASLTASIVVPPPQPAAETPKTSLPIEPAVAASPKPAQAAAETTSTPAAAIPEAVGTRRMYAAHAPLRTPAVADPDSGQNRQILQTMVSKALARATEPQPFAKK